jgi:outer membrane protein OmpA-like peptidoglycan-associated protein
MKSAIRIMIAVTLLLSLSLSANCQIKIKDKLRKVEGSIDNRTDQGIERGLDALQNGLGKALKKKDQTDESQQVDDNQVVMDSGETVYNNGDQAPQQQQTSLQSYSKYDFIPGEKVIFYDDFSQDAVGDFPALWNTNGSAEVVTTNLYPGNWMKFVGDHCVWTDELLKLPDNYTIEFDIIPVMGEEGETMAGYYFRLYQSINQKAWDGGAVPGKAGFNFAVEYTGRPTYRTYVNGDEGELLGLTGYIDDEELKQKKDQKYHIAVWVQKSRVRLYQEQNKIIDLPKAFPVNSVKMDRIRFEYGAAMISNIRIAVGAPDMRNKLMTEGKLVTYGIYFDVNKDIVKPESYGTLKEIAAILNEVPDVQVSIVGHTDSDGADAANLDLSKRRAASVKKELVNSFGVNGDRLATDGLGESQPVAPNDSPASKALNRRVEFIKL